MGAAKEMEAECRPRCHPRNFPDSAMIMFANCGTLIASQFLIHKMRSLDNFKTVIIKTHFVGFKCNPAHLAARSNIGA